MLDGNGGKGVSDDNRTPEGMVKCFGWYERVRLTDEFWGVRDVVF